MAEYTENLNLFEPGTDDNIGIEESLKTNFDRIDEKLGDSLKMPDGKTKTTLGQRLNEMLEETKTLQTQMKDEMNEEFNKVVDDAMVGSLASRGAARFAPENTLAAFYAAFAGGFWGIRTDIRMTKDKEFVCLTDATIDRTSSSTGNVADKNLAELKAMDFGSWYMEIYTGERIPTMSQFLEFCHDYNMIAYLEIPITLTVTEIESLISKINEKGMINSVAIVCFDFGLLKNIRDLYPRVAIGYGSGLMNQTAIDRVKELKRAFLYTNITQITTANMKLSTKSNVKVDAYTLLETKFEEIENAVRRGVRRVTSRKHNYHPF
ncbi:glycerophosphodiester phosphodiesterase [Peribacillus simplex]|uniref:glycerophosphodiester phosphodiesterase n=1 Tax=Peribacillus simplex TaxID=1478 RepID=UPI003D2E3B61